MFDNAVKHMVLQHGGESQSERCLQKPPSLQSWDVWFIAKQDRNGLGWGQSPFSISLKGQEIALQALHRLSETDFKFIQLNWSEYSGYIQQDWFAPLLNQFSLIGTQNY